MSTKNLNVRNCPLGENALDDKQRLAIDLLISGAKRADIAQRLDIDPRTLRRWQANRAFQKVLRERRRSVLSESADEIRSLISPAIDVLRRELAQEYDRARFRAATAILRLSGIRDIMNRSATKGRGGRSGSER